MDRKRAIERRRKAAKALRLAEAAREEALREIHAAEADQAAAEERDTEVIAQTLKKLSSNVRDGKAIEKACETLAMRYDTDSGLRRIDVRSFTILVERVNLRVLRRFHNKGVPEPVLSRTKEMPLPEPFWLDYHESVRKSDCNLSKLYFTGT